MNSCYCVCHSPLSSCPSCIHCHGEYLKAQLAKEKKADQFTLKQLARLDKSEITHSELRHLIIDFSKGIDYGELQKKTKL